MGQEPGTGDRQGFLALDQPHSPAAGRCRSQLWRAVVALAVAFFLPGCNGPSTSEALLADAERLRLRHEKETSATALVRFREALEAAQSAGDHRTAARAGQGLGATYAQLGLLQPSLQAYREAVAHAGRQADRVL